MQTSVVERSEKSLQSNALSGMLVYKKIKFEYVHHQSYKQNGIGLGPFQHSRRKHVLQSYRCWKVKRLQNLR